MLLLNLIAFGVAIPILPPLVLALGGSATDVGLIFALQAAGQFLAAPLWGQTSDRHGRRPVLLVTIAGAALADGLTAGCGALWMLYVARLLAGLFAGNVAAASALIADATDRDSRSKGMALIGICFGLGFTIGPAVGGLISFATEHHEAALLALTGGPTGWLGALGALDSRLPFGAAAALNVACVLLGVWLLREARPERLRQAYRPRRGLLVTLRRRPVLVMCTLYLVYTVASTILEATFFLYMAERHGFDQAGVGLIFAALGLLMAGIQGGVGRISARLGDRRMTGLGALLMAAGLALAPTSELLEGGGGEPDAGGAAGLAGAVDGGPRAAAARGDGNDQQLGPRRAGERQADGDPPELQLLGDEWVVRRLVARCSNGSAQPPLLSSPACCWGCVARAGG